MLLFQLMTRWVVIDRQRNRVQIHHKFWQICHNGLHLLKEQLEETAVLPEGRIVHIHAILAEMLVEV